MNRTLPSRTNLLFWTPEEQAFGYKNVDKVFHTNVVPAGGPVYPLPQGDPLGDIRFTHEGRDYDLASYAEANKHHALLVVKDGQIRLEQYFNGMTAEDRWISFSIAKSFTSTLVGCALKDGLIGSLDDVITAYIPDLAGSGYDGVTIRQVLTMSSGVAWSEVYADPNSDVARMGFTRTEPGGRHPIVEYMRKLPRAHPPGTKNHYSTGETDLIGILVAAATGKTLSAYLSEKLWKPFGMEADAAWVCDAQGRERGGSNLFARARDYARMGLFMLGGGYAGGERIVPEGWVEEATRTHFADVVEGVPGVGYGYQWWTAPEGVFRGTGVFGQTLWVHPPTQLIIVAFSTWPAARDPERALFAGSFIKAVREAAV